MAKEIERKFLVVDTSYRDLSEINHEIRQGYLCRIPESTVRVRIRDNEAFLTVKSSNDGTVRDEWEYPVPVGDALEMLAQCCRGKLIEKTRYVVPFGALTWEVDEFHGAREGLVVAEVELPSADTPLEHLPPFVGVEVTGDPRYYNSNL